MGADQNVIPLMPIESTQDQMLQSFVKLHAVVTFETVRFDSFYVFQSMLGNRTVVDRDDDRGRDLVGVGCRFKGLRKITRYDGDLSVLGDLQQDVVLPSVAIAMNVNTVVVDRDSQFNKCRRGAFAHSGENINAIIQLRTLHAYEVFAETTLDPIEAGLWYSRGSHSAVNDGDPVISFTALNEIVACKPVSSVQDIIPGIPQDDIVAAVGGV